MNAVVRFAAVGLLLLSGLTPAAAEPVSFRRAIELALSHSGAMAIAAAEQVRARQSYLEQRNLYLPQLTLGSGLGASYGFPLSIEGSAPSIFNLNTQQYIYNPSHRQFLKAAKTEWDSSATAMQDRRDAVVLETALTYIQLDTLASSIRVLQQQEAAAVKVEQISNERLQAGVDSEVEVTRARLALAKVRMRLAEGRGSAGVLRLRLAQLTGLAAESIETQPESIPDLPSITPEQDVVTRAVTSSPAIKLANDKAVAQEYRAKGEARGTLPSFDLAGQYALLSRANNYEEFFQKFQRHNATIGLAVRFPFLNLSQRARAQAADAEAVKALKEADAVRDQVATDARKLQASIAQLAAARDIAQLEHQLARAALDATQARIDSGQASLRDQENARASEHAAYSAFLDATYQLQRAQLQLLRLTGDLQPWATGNRLSEGESK